MKMPMLLLSVSMLALALGKTTGPCCKACPSGKEKYYSVPSPTDPKPQCGEFCAKPSMYPVWKLFEPKLLKGDCATQGFTKYISTETDGVWPLACTNDRYVREDLQTVIADMHGTRSSTCPERLQTVFADMHDGDKKEIIISGTSITIKPSGNDQTWVVKSELDQTSCSAKIDFNVPGKPNPPPVILLAQWMNSDSATDFKGELLFTDPSGKLAAKDFPLNVWSQITKTPQEPRKFGCHTSLTARTDVFADMHDGDKKEITIVGTSMTIKPSGNNQTWVVETELDAKSCSAKVDFNVPGKPNPPPVSLTATLWYDLRGPTELEFTDPTGALAAADFPLNRWVAVKSVEFQKQVPTDEKAELGQLMI